MRRIFCMGGGGFGMAADPSEPTLLDDYLLRLTGRDRPRICFIPTASGDAESYIENFHRAFPSQRAETSVLKLFGRTEPDLQGFLMGQDVLHVGGGSTANMLACWRVHGLDMILPEVLDAGVIGTGMSAGAMCWFEACLTDSFGEVRPLSDGLGLLPHAACPHYHGQPTRRPRLIEHVEAGELPRTLAIDDGVGVLFEDGQIVEAVGEEQGAGAFHVGRGGIEEPLEVRYLGESLA